MQSGGEAEQSGLCNKALFCGLGQVGLERVVVACSQLCGLMNLWSLGYQARAMRAVTLPQQAALGSGQRIKKHRPDGGNAYV